METAHGTLAGWFDANGPGKPFAMGDTISYVDVIVVSWLMFMQRVIPSDEWAKIASWDGGRWGELVGKFE